MYNNLKSFLCPSLTIFNHNLDQNFTLFLQSEYHDIYNIYVCVFLVTYLNALIAPIFFIYNTIYLSYKKER